MKFEEGKTYILENPKGFADSFIGNEFISNDIMKAGGTITVLKLHSGNVVKFLYADGGRSEFQSIMASEIRFFKLQEENQTFVKAQPTEDYWKEITCNPSPWSFV